MDFKNKVKAGDIEAIRMAHLVYTNEVLIDIFESLALEIHKQSTKCDMKMKPQKLVITRYVKAARHMARDQHRYIGVDASAEKFGDVADFLTELILTSIFIPEENRIKLISQAKLMNNAKTNLLI